MLNRDRAPTDSNASYTSAQKKEGKTSLQESLSNVKSEFVRSQLSGAIPTANFSTPKQLFNDSSVSKLEESRPKWSQQTSTRFNDKAVDKKKQIEPIAVPKTTMNTSKSEVKIELKIELSNGEVNNDQTPQA